ncbi:hypothetical protein EJB10_02605 [Wolbachia endosymbiont of Brugia malayi]|uniref:hypothetical protein n=1 Tax=Wolbachia endosymbiont of Brugia malayi TaxID=80849 RepID=UPI0005A276A0|nr:hypothetical protein [Wolbachia endosymbiont of Brugia malayi]QCB61676.1 hypothetical protein EJB10_02605 [Wolbachia endosymbiont of Brugia malayi]
MSIASSDKTENISPLFEEFIVFILVADFHFTGMFFVKWLSGHLIMNFVDNHHIFFVCYATKLFQRRALELYHFRLLISCFSYKYLRNPPSKKKTKEALVNIYLKTLAFFYVLNT